MGENSTSFTWPAIFKVDVFAASTSLGKQQLARRQLYKLDPEMPEHIWVATAEDTILAKLHWYRIGGEALKETVARCAGNYWDTGRPT